LVARILREGDGRAFDRLYDRHTPALYGLALRLTGGDAAGAEDVVHDGWIRAMERLGRFRWESALRTWLTGFIINGVRERIRQDARELPALDEQVPGDDTALREAVSRVDLERAVAGLPDGFRHVLILHDVEGYTHEEIAAVLGVVPGTSKSQLARARAAVRRALGRATEG
jgi:RNA polymerase sigma-70 factor (ECF subfamily)